MNIVIEHLQVKRQLNGSGFNICGSREDLLRIAEQIKDEAEYDFTYGWISVRDKQLDEHSTPNATALPWS